MFKYTIYFILFGLGLLSFYIPNVKSDTTNSNSLLLNITNNSERYNIPCIVLDQSPYIVNSTNITQDAVIKSCHDLEDVKINNDNKKMINFTTNLSNIAVALSITNTTAEELDWSLENQIYYDISVSNPSKFYIQQGEMIINKEENTTTAVIPLIPDLGKYNTKVALYQK